MKIVGHTPASTAHVADASIARTTQTETHARIALKGIAPATETTEGAVSRARDT